MKDFCREIFIQLLLMKNFIFVFTLVLVQLATAQEKGIIKGQLLDGEFNDEPLAYASVSLKGTIIGTETDEEGNYRFSAPAERII